MYPPEPSDHQRFARPTIMPQMACAAATGIAADRAALRQAGRLCLMPRQGGDCRFGVVLRFVSDDPELIRAAALAWLDRVTLGGELDVTREQLANDFLVAGTRFPLIDRGRGIRKPRGWPAALSIATAVPASGRPRPYDDVEGADGLHRYKLRRDEGGRAENDGLRAAMHGKLPLIWFYGVAPRRFRAIFPVYLLAEEADLDQFVLALTPDQARITPGSLVEDTLRRYLVAQTRRRLHQPVFASQVMLAYETRCAVCALGHRELLDAAHIIADADRDGEPVLPNGLALCKIHHAAYDRNILGIRPDYTVEIHGRLLSEVDGPMLQHGLQDHHGQPLMKVPSRVADRPDPLRLVERFKQFQAA
jgi:putative restriction endonuclease